MGGGGRRAVGGGGRWGAEGGGGRRAVGGGGRWGAEGSGWRGGQDIGLKMEADHDWSPDTRLQGCAGSLVADM